MTPTKKDYKITRAKSPFCNAEEVKTLLMCSRTSAYNIIRQLNEELKKKGYLTFSGRISRVYLYERFGLVDESAETGATG